MELKLKTRTMISNELGYGDVKTLMRHLKELGVVLPKRTLLTPHHQKLIYDALFYPKGEKREWYAEY